MSEQAEGQEQGGEERGTAVWWWIDWDGPKGRATFAVEEFRGKIQTCPPIIQRWAQGRKADRILQWLREHGATVQRLPCAG